MKYYVDASVSRAGDGSREYPFKTIQAAADLAVAGDEVLVFPGIYRELRRAEFHSPIVVELWYEDDLRGYTILKDHLDYFRSVDAAVLREIQNAV